MNVLVTPESVKTIVDGSKSVTDVIAGVSNELIAEAINLFIINSTLEILKYSVVFVIFFILKKYLSSLQETSPGVVKSLNTALLIFSLAFFAVKSMPHLKDVTKALVAPKIFLLEKGSELLKKG